MVLQQSLLTWRQDDDFLVQGSVDISSYLILSVNISRTLAIDFFLDLSFLVWAQDMLGISIILYTLCDYMKNGTICPFSLLFSVMWL